MFVYLCSFWPHFLTLLSFWFNFFSFSFYSLLCFDSRTFFLKKKRDSLEKHGRMPTRRSGKTWVFVLPIFLQKKRMFFKTNKSEKYIFSNVQKNQKVNVEGTIFEIFPQTERKFRKTILGVWREGFFWCFFFYERTRLKKARKRRNQKGEEQLKKFHRKRWKEETKKETEKKHEGLAKIKGREKFFFFEKKCGNKKKGEEGNNEEGRQREKEHQSGTYKGVETWKEWTDRKRNKGKWQKRNKLKHKWTQEG